MRFLMMIMMLFPVSLFAETFDVSKIQSSNVQWLAVGNPGFLKIESKNATLSGQLDLNGGMMSGSLVMKLDEMKTGIKLRDDHTKEKYLETSKYPDAKFVLEPTKMASAFKAKGMLSLHGVDKSVTWDCQAAKGGGSRKISCVSTIVLTDFNIAIPTYLGVTVAKDVKIKVVLVI